MINYRWSPCQEGVKKTPLLTITPRVPGVLFCSVAQGVGCWEETELPPVLVCAGLCTVLHGECQRGSGGAAHTLPCLRVPCTLLLCRAVHQQLAVGTGTSITASSTWHWGTQGLFPASVALACLSGGSQGAASTELSSLLPQIRL